MIIFWGSDSFLEDRSMAQPQAQAEKEINKTNPIVFRFFNFQQPLSKTRLPQLNTTIPL
jgi:hypothetical protein